MRPNPQDITIHEEDFRTLLNSTKFIVLTSHNQKDYRPITWKMIGMPNSSDSSSEVELLKSNNQAIDAIAIYKPASNVEQFAWIQARKLWNVQVIYSK